MKVSVLLPTRKRVAACMAAIQSLRDTIDAPHELEVLLRIDDDDNESLSGFSSGGDTRVIVGIRHGYIGMNQYINELAALATGDWLLIWNDDVKIISKSGWANELALYDGQIVVLHENNGGTCFPIIPRRVVEILGHYSAHLCCDSYVVEIGRQLGVLSPLTYFSVAHTMIAPDGDETQRDRYSTQGTEPSWDDFGLPHATEAANKLRAYL